MAVIAWLFLFKKQEHFALALAISLLWTSKSTNNHNFYFVESLLFPPVIIPTWLQDFPDIF
jgi:hypothetical protein